MKKLALVTGGTRGIGWQIADNLRDEYDVVTVGRSENADVSGDLRNKFFREYLLEKYTPDIFINNAASLYYDPYKMMEINGTVPVELLMKFYEKMSKGIIINISSQSAERHVRPKEELTRSVYSLAKRHLKDVSLALNYSKNKPIKVMCLSPGAVHTEMSEHVAEWKPEESMTEPNKDYNWDESIAWTKTWEVAEIVRWMINLPEHIVIPEIVLDNHYSKATYW